jgi:hypothetical protein
MKEINNELRKGLMLQLNKVLDDELRWELKNNLEKI